MKNNKNFKKERKEVARFMRRLYNKSLTTSSGGNISIKITDEIIALTTSATDKGKMKWKEVGLINIMGENLTPDLKLSTEYAMHLKVYKKNQNINAIIHAHPLFATSFTAMKGTINTSLTAEGKAVCGEPRLVPYALTGSDELAEKIAEISSDSDVMLLENHGIVTTGTTLLQAFDKIEVLENAAKMTIITEIGGRKRPLNQSRIREIEKLFR